MVVAVAAAARAVMKECCEEKVSIRIKMMKQCWDEFRWENQFRFPFGFFLDQVSAACFLELALFLIELDSLLYFLLSVRIIGFVG